MHQATGSRGYTGKTHLRGFKLPLLYQTQARTLSVGNSDPSLIEDHTSALLGDHQI
ncbi:hypothetical protein [uncultured Nostoc sp.]|uniref:hypothetical protein n=1 Tax=uncultured Nostoc sp. TaxID=340711 RepID=UPI0035CB34DE